MSQPKTAVHGKPDTASSLRRPKTTPDTITGVKSVLLNGDFSKVKNDERYLNIREHIYDVNRVTTKMGVYEPLVDDALQDFFQHPSVKKHLTKIGFIDDNGQILTQKEFHQHHIRLDTIERSEKNFQNIMEADMNIRIDSAIRKEIETLMSDPTAKKRRLRSVVSRGVDVTKLSPTIRHTAEIYLSSFARPKTARESSSASSKTGGHNHHHHMVTKEPYTTKSSLLRTEFVRRKLELMKMEETLEEEKRIKVGTFIEYPGYKANEFGETSTADFEDDEESYQASSQRPSRPQSATVKGRRAHKESVESAIKDEDFAKVIDRDSRPSSAASHKQQAAKENCTAAESAKSPTGLYEKLKRPFAKKAAATSATTVVTAVKVKEDRPLSASGYKRPHTATSKSRASSKHTTTPSATTKKSPKAYEQEVFDDIAFDSDDDALANGPGKKGSQSSKPATTLVVVNPTASANPSQSLVSMIVHPDKANPKLSVNLTAGKIGVNNASNNNQSVASIIVHNDKVNPAIPITKTTSATETTITSSTPSSPVAGTEDSKKSVFSFFKKSKNSSQQELAVKNSSKQDLKSSSEALKPNQTSNKLTGEEIVPQQNAAEMTLFAADIGGSQNNLAGSKKHVTFGGSSSDYLAASKKPDTYTISSTDDALKGSKGILRNSKSNLENNSAEQQSPTAPIVDRNQQPHQLSGGLEV